MASAKQLLTDSLECPVCHDLLSKPKLLPCSHTFCESCLSQLHSTVNISCPICRQVYPVPNDSVSNFPTNQIVKSLAEDFKQGSDKKIRSGKKNKLSNDQLCTVCNSDDQDTATYYCQNCSEFLCDLCLQHHNQYKRNALHELVEAIHIQTGIVKMQFACPEHRQELQKYVCITCLERICCRCLEVDHQSDEHETIGIAEYEESLTEEFEFLKQKIEQKNMTIEKNLSFVEDKLQTVKDTVGQRKQQIQNTYDAAAERMQRRKDELLEKCNNYESSLCQELEGIIEGHNAFLEAICDKVSAINNKANKLHQPDQSLSEYAARVNGLEAILHGNPLLSLLLKSTYIAHRAELLTFHRAAATNPLHIGTVHINEYELEEEPVGTDGEATRLTRTQGMKVTFSARNEEIILSLDESLSVHSRERTRDRMLGFFSNLFRRMKRRPPDMSEKK